MTRQRLFRYGLLAVVLISLAGLVVIPGDQSAAERRSAVGWVAVGLVVGEILFAAGLAVMAWTAGVRLGLNPLSWKARLPQVLASLDRSPWFWSGFALNTVGAVTSAAVVAAGVVSGLPPSAWGLLVLPALDLSLTFSLRALAFGGIHQKGTGSDP
ncbi:MAG: hypothetical protein ACK5PP_18310 [Acidimicrobiales bacterium]